jgi:hypothetical protein
LTERWLHFGRQHQEEFHGLDGEDYIRRNIGALNETAPEVQPDGDISHQGKLQWTYGRARHWCSRPAVTITRVIRLAVNDGSRSRFAQPIGPGAADHR